MRRLGRLYEGVGALFHDLADVFPHNLAEVTTRYHLPDREGVKELGKRRRTLTSLGLDSAGGGRGTCIRI